MARSGPQKAIFPESDLPILTLFKDGTFGYRIRYRIVSEDSNRFSHYSPTYTVRPNYIFVRPEGVDLDEVDIIRRRRYVNLFWGTAFIQEKVSQNIIRPVDRYDVWLKWERVGETGVWIPAPRSELDGPRLGFPVPSSYDIVVNNEVQTVQEEPTRLSVEVYVRARPQTRAESLLVYKVEEEDIEPPLPDPST